MKSKNPLNAAADKLDAAQQRYFRSEKGKEALRRYFSSVKGKEALSKAQTQYYQGKIKPEREVAKQCKKWLEQHSGKTVEDFLKEMKGEQDTDNR